MNKKFVIFLLFVILLITIGLVINYQLINYSLITYISQPTNIQNQSTTTPSQLPIVQNQTTNIQDQPPKVNNQLVNTPSQAPVIKEKNILLAIPFSSQAPFGNWSDPKEQNGCEEASALMAVYWARNKSLTPQIALNEIIAISDYELKNYNNYYDTSAPDTVIRIFNGYFNFTNVEVKYIKSAADIINELKLGNAVIIPINGQIIGNPNYKRPGPLEHNLLIKGYDFVTAEFITNDSGTRKGNSYRYKKDILWQSLRDYPTGNKTLISKIIKNMIVISNE